ncbi:MAG: hypothetical protein QW688_05695 [Thermoprotei archaeon]
MPKLPREGGKQHPSNTRKKLATALESLLVATVLSLFIVGITFILLPNTLTVKTLLSAASLTLIYPAFYSAAKRTPTHTKHGVGRKKEFLTTREDNESKRDEDA